MSTLKKGDLVLFGAYNGAPIKWLVADEGKNGYMLISVKAVTMKPFDAKGPYHENSREKLIYGSGHWARSNLRQWLNSGAEKIDWWQNPPIRENIWRGQNPYAGEAGFLSAKNFTEDDLRLINTVDNATPQAKADGGGEFVTRDKMFVPSKAEYVALLKDTAYEMTRMTPEAAAKSDFAISPGEDWRYWLREVMTDHPHTVMHVIPGGMAVYDNSAAFGHVGVRPACWINPEALVVKAGDGSAGNPYAITGKVIPPKPRTASEDGVPVDVSWYFGSPAGSETKPYVLTTEAQLRGLATLVNDVIDSFEGKYFVLGNDIDISSADWMPIGAWNTAERRPDDSIMFCGCFDGKGHAITGLKAGSGPEERLAKYQFFGLFGILGPNTTVQNLSLTGEIYAAPSMPPVLLCGSVSGINRGRILNCRTDVKIDAQADFLAYVGGIVAVGYYHIKNCTVRGDITAYAERVCNLGGIAAYNGIDSVIRNNASYANLLCTAPHTALTAGCIGSNAKNRTENCYATGTLVSLSDVFEAPDPDGNLMPCGCAGLAGMIFCAGVPDMCYWNEKASGKIVILNMNKKFAPKDVRPMKTDEMKTDAFCELLNANVDAIGDPELKRWARRDGLNGGYPYHA